MKLNGVKKLKYITYNIYINLFFYVLITFNFNS